MDPYAQIVQGNTSSSQIEIASGDPYSQIITGQKVPQAEQTTDPYAKLLQPKDVNGALSLTGKQDENGLCQQFVEKMVYGKTGLFPSAASAWDSYVQNGQAKTGTKGMLPGDIIYFTPNQSNQGEGHTGIYMGKGQFVSATDNGIMPYDVNRWTQDTGQSILGYVKP